MIIREYIHSITNRLQPLYDSREAAAIAKLYVQSKLDLPAYELALRGNEVLIADELAVYEKDVERLIKGCPLQYVLGKADFYGLEFEVTPDTLIPRPETEELVQQVVEVLAEKENPTIWDVGTGSGCIAIALAKQLPQARVLATDVSESALMVARRNASRHGAAVELACHDMCDVEHLPFENVRFDAIVSNPPYIPESVRGQMHVNVREYEPAGALFVPTERPLLYYEALAKLSYQVLKRMGYCFMETFDDYHAELSKLFLSENFSFVASRADINGKPRIFIAQR